MEGYNADPTDHVNTDFIDWRDRRYFGRNTVQTVGLSLVGSDGTSPLDADGDVKFSYYAESSDATTPLFTDRIAAHPSTGLYEITLSAEETGSTGNFYGVWTYQVGGQDEVYTVYMVVGESNPAYDQLPEDFKQVVDNVWVRFADLFDSAEGGPNLQSYFQAKWSRGRIAQLMAIAVQKINGVAQPWTGYTLNGVGGPKFPTEFWGGLLASYTYVEGVKQLIRAYTEQPAFAGPPIARQDRRDYAQRWRQVLEDEQAELKSQLDVFKIRHIMSGSPRVLVSGGTYGRYAPTRIAGSVAARPRMWARWY